MNSKEAMLATALSENRGLEAKLADLREQLQEVQHYCNMYIMRLERYFFDHLRSDAKRSTVLDKNKSLFLNSILIFLNLVLQLNVDCLSRFYGFFFLLSSS